MSSSARSRSIRTWLQTDGAAKASFRNPRLSLGPIGGGAVRLAEAREDVPLVIAEGIETAASVDARDGLARPGPRSAPAASSGWSCRPCRSPRPSSSLPINDANGTGERAARIAAERWIAEGRRVRIALPPRPGTDWNDVLLGKDRNDIREARDAA